MKTYRVKRNITQLKIKASEDADVEAEIEGFITTFEDPENHDSYGEIISKGAINLDDFETLPMLNNHQATIGTWREFSIKEARQGVEGLYAKGVIVSSPEGATLAKLIRLKSIEGLSIGFYVKKGGEEELADHITEWGFPVIRLNAIDPREASPTSFPSNKHATIHEVRSEHLRRHLGRNPLSAPRIRIKAENLSTAINNAITAQAEADEAITEEQIIEALTTALDLSSDTVSAILAGQVLLATMEQLEIVAETLGVDVAALQAEAAKDAEVFMAEDGDGDDDDDDDEEITEEEEAEILAELDEMSEDLEAMN